MFVAHKITSYFDASSGQEHPAVIVAGYISTVAQWKKFDKEWRKVLARREFDVPYFHMKEFAHSAEVFKSWKGDEHRRVAHVFILLTAPRQRVPHPCVLCKGGNHELTPLRFMNLGPCCPPFRTKRERMGHPQWNDFQERAALERWATRPKD